jgi:hypothetical protein
MEYQNVLEFIGKDRTNIYKVTDYGEWPVRHDDLSQAQPGMYYLFHPLLSYGDYDDSTDVNRSNVRVFEREYKEREGWKMKTYADDGIAIYIDVTCTDADIIKTLQALSDYPLLDEMDCSQVAVEIEQQAWDSYLKRDFKDAIEKRFNADYSDPDDDELQALYFELQEKTNLHAEIVGGGNVRINLSRLVDAIAEPPAFLKLEWW